MSLVAFLFVGLVAGFVANIVQNTPRSLAGTVLLGVLGAYVGGALSSWLLGLSVDGFNLTSVIIAAFGALFVPIIIDFVSGVVKEL